MIDGVGGNACLGALVTKTCCCSIEHSRVRGVAAPPESTQPLSRPGAYFGGHSTVSQRAREFEGFFCRLADVDGAIVEHDYGGFSRHAGPFGDKGFGALQPIGSDDGFSAATPAASGCSGKAGAYAFANKVAFELSEGGEHVEQEPTAASWCRSPWSGIAGLRRFFPTGLRSRLNAGASARDDWGAARLSETSGCGKLNRNRRYRDDSR